MEMENELYVQSTINKQSFSLFRLFCKILVFWKSKYELVGGVPKARSTMGEKSFGKRNQCWPFRSLIESKMSQMSPISFSVTFSTYST